MKFRPEWRDGSRGKGGRLMAVDVTYQGVIVIAEALGYEDNE